MRNTATPAAAKPRMLFLPAPIAAAFVSVCCVPLVALGAAPLDVALVELPSEPLLELVPALLVELSPGVMFSGASFAF